VDAWAVVFAESAFCCACGEADTTKSVFNLVLVIGVK
jgi:hypothetical protein